MKSVVTLTTLLFILFQAAHLFAQAASPDTSSWYGIGGTWSPYLAGALIGVLSWLTFYFSKQPIGASSFYATMAGLIGKAIAPRHTRTLTYYQEHSPKINWEFAFVIAIIFGSALAAALGG